MRGVMGVFSVDEAERIATSQAVWAILFIMLFGAVILYLIRTSEKREAKLMEFHEQSKNESNVREERLLNHLEKTTNQLGEISNTIGDIQSEMVRMNSRMENIERKK